MNPPARIHRCKRNIVICDIVIPGYDCSNFEVTVNGCGQVGCKGTRATVRGKSGDTGHVAIGGYEVYGYDGLAGCPYGGEGHFGTVRGTVEYEAPARDCWLVRVWDVPCTHVGDGGILQAGSTPLVAPEAHACLPVCLLAR